jgi:hypothetical protein
VRRMTQTGARRRPRPSRPAARTQLHGRRVTKVERALAGKPIRHETTECMVRTLPGPAHRDERQHISRSAPRFQDH